MKIIDEDSEDCFELFWNQVEAMAGNDFPVSKRSRASELETQDPYTLLSEFIFLDVLGP